jgi:hypothetical protein
MEEEEEEEKHFDINHPRRHWPQPLACGADLGAQGEGRGTVEHENTLKVQTPFEDGLQWCS